MDLGQVVLERRFQGCAGEQTSDSRRLGCAGQVGHHPGQVGGGVDPEALDQGGLRGVGGRHEERLHPLGAERPRRHQHAIGVADGAVQRQLADEGGARRRALLGHGQRDGHGHGEVEAAALLAQLGRGEVDRQPPEREAQAAVAQRGPDALPRLFDARVTETDQVEGDVSGCDVDLDLDQDAFETAQEAGED